MAALAEEIQLTVHPCDESSTAIEAAVRHIREDKGVIQSIHLVCRGPSVSKRAVLSDFEGHEGNWLVHLYKSDDEASAHRVLQTAERHAGIEDTQRPNRIVGGVERRQTAHHVFAVVHRNVVYTTDFSQDKNATIQKYLRRGKNPPFYIGIGSGPDAITAMKRRRIGDNYKECHGVNVMIAIYKSRDQEKCRAKEAELIDYFRDTPGILNRAGGGGGRYTEQEHSYVYLAVSSNVLAQGFDY